MNQVEQLKWIKDRIVRFMMMYQFALNELETRIDILKEEFHLLHDYNPIEHTKTRLKSPESIMNKLLRKGGGGSLDNIKDKVKDIAGMRITCSFISDIYWIRDMLQSQSDLNIVEVKDYIAHPKPNGYQSLHLLIEVPIYTSDRRELVCVEVQIRTIAMDFWASLEHKIFYKYNGSVPQRLLAELKGAADVANALDVKMESLHREVEEIKSAQHDGGDAELARLISGDRELPIPRALLELIGEEERK